MEGFHVLYAQTGEGPRSRCAASEALSRFCRVLRNQESHGRPEFRCSVGVQLKAMVLDRITRNPAVMGGEPCVRGMRVMVGTIVGLVASGRTTAEILTAYPYIEEEDIRQALAYAAWRVEELEVPLPTA